MVSKNCTWLAGMIDILVSQIVIDCHTKLGLANEPLSILPLK